MNSLQRRQRQAKPVAHPAAWGQRSVPVGKHAATTGWCPLCRGWDDVLRSPTVPDPQALFAFGFIVAQNAGPTAAVCSAHRWVTERMRPAVKRAGW